MGGTITGTAWKARRSFRLEIHEVNIEKLI